MRDKFINIIQATRLPGTDIILDVGDKIEILPKKGRTRESHLSNHILSDYERQAQAARDAGAHVEIDYRLPTVAITLGHGEDYFFQGEEASDLLNEVPDNIDDEDYLLAIALGW